MFKTWALSKRKNLTVLDKHAEKSPFNLEEKCLGEYLNELWKVEERLAKQ
jgi:hypothetical protein